MQDDSMPAPAEKRCTACGETKPLDLFALDNRKSFSRSSHCKACKARRTHAWRLARPDYAREMARRSYHEHREQARERRKRYPRTKIDATSARAAAIRRAALAQRTKIHDIVRAVREERGCYCCGEKHPACLEWHHRDAASKAFSIADAGRLHVSPQALAAELAKCDLLCANCHRKVHYEQRQGALVRAS